MLAAGSLVYGQWETRQPLRGKPLRVAVIQGNIAQTRKWNPKYAAAIMQTYRKLTVAAAKEHPDLIIWPETATPGSIGRNPKLLGAVWRLSQQTASPLLLGSAQMQKFGPRGLQKKGYTNSAFLIDPPGAPFKMGRYDKIRLLPFGEYLPYKKTIPWSQLRVPEVGGYRAGDQFILFRLKGLSFAVTICWENIFPDIVRRFVQNGARLIVNITNEAWFGQTAAPYQFVSMSVLRAVENRVWVVRCANTGVSCFIDPFGRITGRVSDPSGRDVFVRGILAQTITVAGGQTFYTRHGDWAAQASAVGGLAFLLVAFAGRRRAANSVSGRQRALEIP